MSTTYAPITEVVSASVVAEATSQFKSMMAAAAPVARVGQNPPVETAIQPAQSFLTPKICSWITIPYYPTNIQPTKIQPPNIKPVEMAETSTAEVLEEAYPIEGFDPSRLAPHCLEMASQSVKSHVHGVIDLLESGGAAACTFGNIFLNDLALQRTVLSGLMNEPGNPLSHVEFQHKELALRLACCGAARDVARLVLAEA